MSASRARDDGGPATRALKPAGGGGTSDGMDARVARLEAHVETLRSDVAAIRADVGDLRVSLATFAEKITTLAEKVVKVPTLAENVATLTERVAHLPSKGFVVTSSMTATAILSGVIIFGEKLKALIGA